MLRHNKGFQAIVKSSPYFEEIGVDVGTVQKIGRGQRADVFSCNQGILRVSGNPGEYFQQFDLPIPRINDADLIMKNGDLYFCSIRDDIPDDAILDSDMIELIAMLETSRKRFTRLSFDEMFLRDDFTSLLTYPWSLTNPKQWSKIESNLNAVQAFTRNPNCASDF